MNSCAHPPERHFAWIAHDAATQADILCLGCTVCGAVLSGAADAKGNAAGAQYRLKIAPKQRRAQAHR